MECLKSRYPVIQALKERINYAGHSDDPPAFRDFLARTLVCSLSSSEHIETRAHDGRLASMVEVLELCVTPRCLNFPSGISTLSFGFFLSFNLEPFFCPRVIQTLVFKRPFQPNMVSNGFRARRESDTGMGDTGVECFFPNSNLAKLKSWEWETVLRRVGESHPHGATAVCTAQPTGDEIKCPPCM